MRAGTRQYEGTTGEAEQARKGQRPDQETGDMERAEQVGRGAREVVREIPVQVLLHQVALGSGRHRQPIAVEPLRIDEPPPSQITCPHDAPDVGPSPECPAACAPSGRRSSGGRRPGCRRRCRSERVQHVDAGRVLPAGVADVDHDDHQVADQQPRADQQPERPQRPSSLRRVASHQPPRHTERLTTNQRDTSRL